MDLMGDFIKLNDEWVEILDVYKKINDEWVLQTDLNSSIITSNVYLYNEIQIDSLETPIISCNENIITITCNTINAEIYYRFNQTGEFIIYNSPIEIFKNTIVESYIKINNMIGHGPIAIENYTYIHDYSLDYFTFRILSNGTIWWQNNGPIAGKTIEYSLNNGNWTSITSTYNGISINVVSGDIIRFRGENQSYAKDKNNYSGFGYGQKGNNGDYHSGAAEFNIEGNIMSLIYGDNFQNQTTFNGGTYNFCSIFKKSKCISAKNLILPVLTLTQYCYRAMFSWCEYLTKAPELPATTLAQGVYWYMFEACSITKAPDLLAKTLVDECYGNMFTDCASLNFIKCLANSGFNTTNCRQTWVNGVASSGTFIKDSGVSVSTWTTGTYGIPTNWEVYDDV